MFSISNKALLIATLLATSLSSPSHATDTSLSLPVTNLQYFDTGVGPLKAAPAFGDLSKGEHGTFIKLPAGFVSPSHKHTEDYYGVVITGVVANGAGAKTQDTPLPPGSYWFQKGDANHVTKCLSKNECVVFLVQPGKFDFIAAEKK